MGNTRELPARPRGRRRPRSGAGEEIEDDHDDDDEDEDDRDLMPKLSPAPDAFLGFSFDTALLRRNCATRSI
jgi:hypothetical protein